MVFAGSAAGRPAGPALLPGGVDPVLREFADATGYAHGLAETAVAIKVEDFRRVPGASLTFDDLSALSEAIGQRLADGADGVVITQGTDTIEETAYLLDLAHTGQQPVVVTGAMRNPTLAGADLSLIHISEPTRPY